jgi:branched-chain amino acid transport system ATP-binding protein
MSDLDATRPLSRVDRAIGLSGASLVPLAILFGFNAVDELDRAVFGVLLPEIKDHFDLDLALVTGLVGVSGLVALLGQLVVGFYGDRGPRVRITMAGALVWALFTLGTGLAPTVVLLAIMRSGSGLGKAVNDPMHSSLIADYYAPEQRVRAYYWHRMANNVGLIVGPFAGGLIAYLFGWRAPFLLFAIPTIILVLLAARYLREPVRGRWERMAAGADEDLLDLEDTPPSFSEAWKVAHQVRTLKRIFISLPWFAASLFGLGAFYALYYDEVFNMNEAARGFLFAGVEPLAIVGAVYGMRLVTRLFLRDPGLIMKLLAVGGVGVGIGLTVMAVAPNLPIALVGHALATVSSAPLTAGIYATMSLVTPPRIRSVSFGIAALWYMPGIALLPLVGAMADSIGIRGGIALMVPIFLIGSFLIASSGGFVADDIRRVQTNARARAELRASRTSGDPKLLICRGVEVAYGQTQVLFGVDFDVHEGEVVALLGTNGAGKSTLLKAIAGSVDMSGGAIYYDGEDVGGLDAAHVTGMGVSLVPGGKGVFPGLTVAENFQLAGWLLRKDEEYVSRSIDESLEFFPVLRERWDQKAGNLSGGEQQMLTIAMALLAKPKLLMIDELSLGLAPIVVEMLLDVVRRISQRGVTVILVEQSVNVALTLAERAVFMEKGEVRFDGPTAELLERPDVLRSVFLEGAAAAVEVQTDGAARATAATERQPYVAPTDRKGRVVTPRLQVHDLSVSFGGIKAVDGVDLDVHAGQIVGLIGPNGAGKTTIFDLICGLLAADTGKVKLEDEDISALAADARGRRGLGRSFQDARLFPSMTVRETIAVALERHLPVKDPLAAVFASPATKATEQLVDEKVDRLIELMRLGAFANKFVFELSTGSRRIVDLACVLAHEPTVLLLDEPSSGIAQRETEALGPLLLDIRDETGAAMVVIEHDMPLITSISDEIVALELGAVVVRGEPGDVVNDPRVVASYLGTSEEVIHRSGELRDALAHTDTPKRRRRRTTQLTSRA